MIIGLTGEKESGKDTVGAYLVKNYQFERKAFADPLKRSVAVLLDIPFHEVDQFKLDDTVFVTTGYKNQALPIVHEIDTDPQGNTSLGKQTSPNHIWSPIREQTFRSFLQRYGTESHRDVFGWDFWIDQTLPKDGYYPGRKIVVTDTRFENEAERIHACGGIVVRIRRESVVSGDTHISEQINFDADYIIENNGSLDELYPRIEAMLEWALNERETV